MKLDPPVRLWGLLVILVLVSSSGADQGPPSGSPRPAPHPVQGPDLRDCNGNGIDDAIDIALGTSSDVDFDGVPDECQDPPPSLRNPADRPPVPSLGRTPGA